jgi:AraC-like DNA-binding protein
MSLRPPAEPPAVGRPPVERRLLAVGGDPGVTAVIAVAVRPRFETDTGITGAEALAHVGRQPLSLIIADLAEGDLDAAFSIRALAARSPDCQIIVIGSIEHAGIADRLAGLHVYGFFTRPVDFGALIARVSSLSADDDSPEGGALSLSRSSAKALEFLSAHYADSFNLDTLARAVGVSPGNMARVFFHDTKRNLRSFRCDVRVEVAKQLLVHEDHKLDRVAEMTGFVDSSHLSRVFRLHTGRSPGQYRVELRSPRPEDARGAEVRRGQGPRKAKLAAVPLRGESGA